MIPQRFEKLLRFARRFEAAVSSDPSASSLVLDTEYRISRDSQRFFEQVVVPSALYYLCDEAFEAARQRLTPQAMVRQIHQNEAMLAAPGPASAVIAKQLIHDPLRLREFLEPSLLTPAGLGPAPGVRSRCVPLARRA